MYKTSTIVLIAVLLLSMLSHADQKPKDKAASTSASEKITQTKTLSPMRAANEKEYKLLKENLGITDPELSRTEVLELIVLAYGKLLDKVAGDIAVIDERANRLEDEVKKLNADADDLKGKTKNLDADVGNLFEWSNKIDKELHDEMSMDFNSIAYKLSKVRKDVAEDLEKHASAINKTADDVLNLRKSVNQNAANIQALSRAVSSWR